MSYEGLKSLLRQLQPHHPGGLSIRILVTGGLGFIGSNLTKQLLADGHEVTVLDNLARNREFGLKVREELSPLPRVTILIGDIRDQEVLRDSVRGQDAVFHLAAVVNVRASVKQPKETMDVNLGGTTAVLEACRDASVLRLIFASTIAVYGAAKYLPYDEDHPTNPLSPYGVSKLAGEHLARIFGELYSIETINLRFSNIYGVGGAGVISVFLDRIARGQPLTVFGGEQSDDFVHVSDAVEAYMLALRYRMSAKSETFNIGSGYVTSINGLVMSLQSLLLRFIDVEFQPAKKGEIKDSRVDFTKASRLLGYSPKVRLGDGLKMMLPDFGLAIGSQM